MNEAPEWTRLLLTKQQQQAEAERADQALRQSQINQAFDSAGKLASAMRQHRLDAIANKLVNEEPVPRAVAVDAQGRPDAAANRAAQAQFKHPVRRGDVAPFTGGVEGLELLERHRAAPHRQIREQTMQPTPARSQPRAASVSAPGYRPPGPAVVTVPPQPARQAPPSVATTAQPPPPQPFADFQSYTQAERDGLDLIAQATTPEQHQQAAGHLFDLYHRGRNQFGSSVTAPRVPVFQSDSDRRALALQQRDLAAAEADWSNTRDTAQANWNGNGRWLNGKSAGDEYMDASRILYEKQQAMPQPRFLPVPERPPSFTPGSIIRQGTRTYKINAQGQPEPI
jgi:hypothetical protein